MFLILTEYQYLHGQPIAEKNSDGTWSDYIYANGQKIARADSFNRYIQFTGSFSAVGNYGEVNLTPASSQLDNQYLIKTGDKLVWRQDQFQAYGGVYFFTTDGSNAAWTLTDQNGEFGNDSMQTDGNWHSRAVDLSPFAGKTVSSVNLVAEGNSPAGNWTMQYADIAVVTTDGRVLPIYNGATSVSASPWGTAGYTFGGITIQSVASATGDTTYYHGDQIGSARMLTSSAGWPVSSDIFYPFGQEQNPTTDPNHYKFTGKERDAESGLDDFGPRYYASSMGRFMSPDDVGGHLEDPQTLNLYSYVGNNPLSRTDPSGHDFYQSCQTQSATCGSQVIGKDVNGKDVSQLVSGTTDSNGKFSGTVITSASLSQAGSGNTAAVNGNGVQITTGTGTSNQQTGQGIFIANTPAADIQGQGAGWNQFSFHIDGNDIAHGVPDIRNKARLPTMGRVVAKG